MENKNKVVYVVKAYYDMDIMKGEEIVIEIYETEELAKARCRKLIDNFKQYHAIEDCESCWGELDEHEYSLNAYVDSEWNVDISYDVEVVRTKLDRQ